MRRRTLRPAQSRWSCADERGPLLRKGVTGRQLGARAPRVRSSRPQLMTDTARRASQVRQADAKTVIGEATAGPTRSDSAARTRGWMSRGANLSARNSVCQAERIVTQNWRLLNAR